MSSAGQKMNCNDYQEAIAADPSESFDGGAEHVSSCQPCSSYRDEIRALNDRIAQALMVDTPELKMPELPPIEVDSNVVNLPFGRLTTPTWIGIAASVAIAVVFGARFLGGDVQELSLADELLAHLDYEPWALQVSTQQVSNYSLNDVLSADVADIGGLGLITYATTCVIHGNLVPHIVLQGEKGPITLLLMPEEMVDGLTPVIGDGIEGVIIPVGNGSIAIIGNRDEMLDKYQQQVIDAVKWTI